MPWYYEWDRLPKTLIHHLEADIFDFRKQRFIFSTQLIMIITIIYKCVPALMKVIFLLSIENNYQYHLGGLT